MKKLIILSAVMCIFTACKDETKTEETTITTETTTDSDALTDETGTTVTKTVETDTSEVSVSVEEADPRAIDTTAGNKKR